MNKEHNKMNNEEIKFYLISNTARIHFETGDIIEDNHGRRWSFMVVGGMPYLIAWHNDQGGMYIPPEQCKEDMDRLNEHDRLSSGIEKFHVKKPEVEKIEVDKIEVDKITPTGETTWVREPSSSGDTTWVREPTTTNFTTCPSVINDTKTYTGQTFTTQEKARNMMSDETLEEIGKSFAKQIEQRPWFRPPTGDFHAKIDPQTNKVVVNADEENELNNYYATMFQEIIEKKLNSMKTEDWIEVNFEVKKLEENNTNNTNKTEEK